MKSKKGTASINLTMDECQALITAVDMLANCVSDDYREMAYKWYAPNTSSGQMLRNLYRPLEDAATRAFLNNEP